MLVGGLSRGLTLRAVLDGLDKDATVKVCKLVPEIAEWNWTFLGHLAGDPLADPRVDLRIGDVMAFLNTSDRRFDAVLLDKDNGPDILARNQNGAIYSRRGLSLVVGALRP